MKAACKPILDDILKENEQLKNEISWLKERVAWFERYMFGPKSERVVEPESDTVQDLPGFEPNKDNVKDQEFQEVPAHKRRKKRKTTTAMGFSFQKGFP